MQYSKKYNIFLVGLNLSHTAIDMYVYESTYEDMKHRRTWWRHVVTWPAWSRDHAGHVTMRVTVTTVVLLCLFVLFLSSSSLFSFPSAVKGRKLISFFSIWKTRAAFSARPLLCVAKRAHGQHESCVWYRGAAPTAFPLHSLKTDPRGTAALFKIKLHFIFMSYDKIIYLLSLYVLFISFVSCMLWL